MAQGRLATVVDWRCLPERCAVVLALATIAGELPRGIQEHLVRKRARVGRAVDIAPRGDEETLERLCPLVHRLTADMPAEQRRGGARREFAHARGAERALSGAHVDELGRWEEQEEDEGGEEYADVPVARGSKKVAVSCRMRRTAPCQPHGFSGRESD